MQLVEVQVAVADFPILPAEAIKGSYLRFNQANGPPGRALVTPAVPGTRRDVAKLDAFLYGQPGQ